MSRKRRGKYDCGLYKIFQGELLNSLKKEYPILGAKIFCERHGLKINNHTLRCFASSIGIKLDKVALLHRMHESRKLADRKLWNERLSLARLRYDYTPQKELLLEEFIHYRSARKIAEKYGLNEYALKKYLKLWGCQLVRNPKYSEFTKKDMMFIYENKDLLTTKEIASAINKTQIQVIKKINKLKITREWKKLQKEKTILFDLTDNPSKRSEVRRKHSIRMKKLITEHPEKSIMGLLHAMRRNHEMTSIEKIVKNILDKNNISYIYNRYVRLGGHTKLPDFNISGKLIIECDGTRFHNDINKEIIRDEIFIRYGFTILHFMEKQIQKNKEEVERCILRKLRELNIQDGRTLAI